uniref:Uncharacterized protein n=1 Tax=Clytia hemisphaerica TaxID=252671 RepID=A0A7M5X3Z5_9CNID
MLLSMPSFKMKKVDILFFGLVAVILSQSHAEESGNRFSFKLRFKYDIGYKQLQCVYIRIHDITDDKFTEYKFRYTSRIVYYLDHLQFGFDTKENLLMSHDYDVTAILNSGWCSLDDLSLTTDQARVKSGDLRTVELLRMSAQPRYDDMRYIMTFDAEIVS